LTAAAPPWVSLLALAWHVHAPYFFERYRRFALELRLAAVARASRRRALEALPRARLSGPRP
jgi:hypothetical protein